MRQEVFEQDANELVRYRFVGDEHLEDREDVHVADGVLDEEVHMARPNFREHMRFEEEEDL